MGKSRTLTLEETLRVFNLGYTIRSQWISPVEGVEYRVSRMGEDERLHYCKSERAAYNWIIRQCKTEA